MALRAIRSCTCVPRFRPLGGYTWPREPPPEGPREAQFLTLLCGSLVVLRLLCGEILLGCPADREYHAWPLVALPIDTQGSAGLTR